MMEQAEFKSARASNAFLGLGLLLIPASVLYLSLYTTEEEFLHTRVRRGGGFLKLIEQTIGWNLFVALMLLFGAWAAVYAIVSLWKAIDSTPDVRALPTSIQFHPAVKRGSISYNDVLYWTVELVSGHPVVWIYLREPYWSLQGLFKRKSVKLEGSKEQLEPLVDYFSLHPTMTGKYKAI